MRRASQAIKRRRARDIVRLAVAAAVTMVAGGLVLDATTSRGSSASAGQWRAARRSGTVQILALRRAGRSSYVWVYRPRVRDSARLPVLYFLHGLPGQAQDVFRYAHLAQVLDSYLARGGAPLVIAAPDGNSPLHSDTEWGNASDGSDELERFILHTAIPAVEGSHPRDEAHRAIAGFSMGGYGAMNIALRHPTVFGQIVTLCGYFHLDDPSRMFSTPASQRANDPDLNVEGARGHRILLMDALQDGESLTNRQSQDFHGRLSRAGIRSTLVTARGTHSWTYVQSQLPTMLRFLAAGWGHNSLH